nr:alpha/beta hydrolase [Tsukamurella asaccharolytica]
MPLRSTVVLIHGGGWKAWSSADLLEPLARALQSRGHPVWNIEYRRVGSGGGWPTTFSDVAAAVDFVSSLARRTTQVRVHDVIAGGHSAGGQLAAWTASRAVDPSAGPGPPPRVVPRAVVALGAALNMAATGRITTNARDVLGGERSVVPRRYELVNPIERINASVPITIVHAADDRIIHYSVVTEYADVARQRGTPVNVVRLPSGGHGGPLDPGPGWNETLRAFRAHSPLPGPTLQPGVVSMRNVHGPPLPPS